MNRIVSEPGETLVRRRSVCNQRWMRSFLAWIHVLAVIGSIASGGRIGRGNDYAAP